MTFPRAATTFKDFTLDMTLRSLESRGSPASQTPFAGKVILLAGDYQQQLPVVRKGNELDVQEATLLNAECWNSRIKLRLSTNHRMRLPPASATLHVAVAAVVVAVAVADSPVPVPGAALTSACVFGVG